MLLYRKVKKNETQKVSKNNIYVIWKGRWIMKKVRFNKRRFFRFVFMVSILAVGAFIEDGNITGALVLAMLI